MQINFSQGTKMTFLDLFLIIYLVPILVSFTTLSIQDKLQLGYIKFVDNIALSIIPMVNFMFAILGSYLVVLLGLKVLLKLIRN